MYGQFVLLDQKRGLEAGQRVYLGEVAGRQEAWLRDVVFENPKILPVEDIDSTFGPLLPLCRELRTDAGIVDAVFINAQGRLTIAEFKRWANPQSRREVVAQTLDYIAALTRWSYSDLQRQVSAALKKQGNIPFQIAKKSFDKELRESEFIDAASRALREGRILALVIGDGVREGVQSIADLVSRSATLAFSFGIVEVALYQFANEQMAIQPRILAQSELIARQVTILRSKDSSKPVELVEDDASGDNDEGLGDSKDHLKGWWAPILTMKFDDPEQDPPRWVGTNNIVLRTSHPGIQIKAWAMTQESRLGVYVRATNDKNGPLLTDFIKANRRYLTENLPVGTKIDTSAEWPIVVANDGLSGVTERQEWLKKQLNAFVNVLTPKLRSWAESKLA